MNNQFYLSLLADPVTKKPVDASAFSNINGVIDARIFLKNTYGFNDWFDGQVSYEKLVSKSSSNLLAEIENYRTEIKFDRPIYEHYRMNGRILDVGGSWGTVREFLPKDIHFISIDPFINCLNEISKSRYEAYACLSQPLNFIAATAEFLPFVSESFDWIHMRSMIDHVQVPDLALMEARRVLKPDGRILIGLYVDGGKSGIISSKERIKNKIKQVLESVGIDHWKDHHIWHPTYKGLCKLIVDNGFEIEDVYWQPRHVDKVCYISAYKVKI